MSITETNQKSKRQDRTIVLYLGNTPAEYRANLMKPDGIPGLIRRVEIADSLNWGHLADGHQEGSPRHLHFTHHDSYVRYLKHFNGRRLRFCECVVWSARRFSRSCMRL